MTCWIKRVNKGDEITGKLKDKFMFKTKAPNPGYIFHLDLFHIH